MARGSERGVKVVIGLVALVFSLVLVYFSSAPALTCTRGSGPGVDCAVTARALWLVTVADDRLANVGSAEMVASAVGNSRTPPHLMFVAGGTRHDLGYFSQLFASEWQSVDEFARNPGAPELRLTKPLSVRTVAAHAAALFLAALGLGLIVSVVRPRY